MGTERTVLLPSERLSGYKCSGCKLRGIGCAVPLPHFSNNTSAFHTISPLGSPLPHQGSAGHTGCFPDLWEHTPP